MKFMTKEDVLSAHEVDPRQEQYVRDNVATKLSSVSRTQTAKSIAQLLFNVRLLYSMLRDADFHLSTKTKAIIVAALLYFVLPVDMIPDYIPFVGYVDDGMVLAAVMRVLANEIQAYKQFISSVA